MSLSDFGTFAFYFIVYGVGFVLGSFGGMFSECSGIINIALEGSMVFGAFSGLIFLQVMSGSALAASWLGVQLIFLLACLIAIFFSCLFSFLLSFVAIKLKADQTIVGTALNTVAIATCTIANTFITRKDSAEVTNNVFSSFLSLNSGNAFWDNAFSNLHVGVIIGIIAIIILWLAMDKTRFGLRLRACGENPAAADSVGINVNKMRYIGTMIGAASAGLGGFVIFSCSQIGVWTIDALGYGFLVLAIEILGNWKSTRIIWASLFFGFFFAFAPSFSAALSNNPNIQSTFFTNKAFFYMLPYLLAFFSLIFFSKKSHAPKAEGIPYDKGAR
jgi:simple sugar transport system permease protein